MRKILLPLAALLIVLLLGASYAVSPLWFISSLKRAVTSGDTTKIDRMVDFPAVRQSLKDQLYVALTRYMATDPSKKSNPFAGLTSLFGTAMIDRMVDSYCTPDMIAAAGKKDAGQRSSVQESFPISLPEPPQIDWSKLQFTFLSFDRFRMGTEAVGAVARLEGFGWKIYRVEFSTEAVEKLAKESQQKPTAIVENGPSPIVVPAPTPLPTPSPTSVSMSTPSLEPSPTLSPITEATPDVEQSNTTATGTTTPSTAPVTEDKPSTVEPTPVPRLTPPSPDSDKQILFILDVVNTLDKHDWQTLTAHTADGSVNYFGRASTSNDYIRRDMQQDARTYSWSHSTYYPDTFTHDTSKEMIYDSINVYSENQERAGRLHKALTRLTVGYTIHDGLPTIYNLDLKVLNAAQSITASQPVATPGDDNQAFFSGAHLGMTIDECHAYYKRLKDIGILWHSGAPTGERQEDFRTSTVPQRRVYVYFRESDKRIVSVLYWKLGENEKFSQAEMQYLANLNRGHGKLTTKVIEGGEFLVTTPRQYQIEQSQ